MTVYMSILADSAYLGNATYDRLVDEKVIEEPFDVQDAFTTQFLAVIYGRQSEQ